MEKKQTAELVDPAGHALIQPVPVSITPMQLLANAQAAGASVERLRRELAVAESVIEPKN
jgi:hypothetical protein